MKWLAVTSLVSSLALAQTDAGTAKAPPPKAAAPAAAAPAKAAPMKGIGSAKDDDDEPPKPLAAKPARGAFDTDAGLLRAILFAFEPAPTEIRVIAIEDLGILGDARGLNPLAQLVMDPNPVVALAAVRAIAAIQHPRAEAILSNVVRHPTLAEKVKLAAIEAIVFQNSNTSVAFLSFLARSTHFHPTLQQQARRVLSELPPGRAL